MCPTVTVDAEEVEQRDADDRGRVRIGPEYAEETVHVAVVGVVGDGHIDTISEIPTESDPDEWVLVQPREYSDRKVYHHDSGPAIETDRLGGGRWRVRLLESSDPRSETIDSWNPDDRGAVAAWFREHICGQPRKVHNG